MKRDRNCYVYLHFIDGSKKPFYVGIGKIKDFKRAFSKKGRSIFWKRIVSKYECISKVIYTNLTWKEACEIEINLISHFGRLEKKTGSLCNLTDGGDGASGVIFTKERRDNISKALKGKKTSEEHKRKCSERKHTKETIEKIRLLKTGLKASEETRAKMRITNMKGIEACCVKIRKIVFNVNSGVFYDSVKDASISVGVTKSHLSGMLNGRYRNWTNLVYA